MTYAAATEGAALFDRGHRTRLLVAGRSPAQMLSGVLTGVMPSAPTEDGGVRTGIGRYHAVLTPKGKMISDAWVYLLGEEEAPGFLLDVPAAGREGLLAHLGKFLPPRFARVQDVSETWGSLALVGPDAPALASRVVLDSAVDPEVLSEAEEGRWYAAGDPAESLTIAATEDVWPPAFLVFGPTGRVEGLRERLVEEGATASDDGVWEALRVEAGRPAFGADMDEATLPPEAGITDRAIDHAKGCYTGQEVIVRIRDRGHVNRYLRRLVLGDVDVPAAGAQLVSTDGSDKVVGRVTSAVRSPELGGVAALAYVARGVERVRLDGAEVAVPADFPGREG